MIPLRKRMLGELQLRNYADFTIERHLDAVQKFAEFFGSSPQRLGAARYGSLFSTWSRNEKWRPARCRSIAPR
jgi:hypothetical protein